MLRLENIVKDYSSKEQVTHVLKGLSVQFRKSEFVSILGHSGCGKTTLLNMIGGLDVATEGTVYLDGKSTRDYNDTDWNLYRNKRIGFVFQSYNLIHHLSILKNVELPLALSEVPKEERKRRALEALEKVGLKDHAKKHPSQLSGGQMQRVAIARALVNNPSIILADEPTGALDSESGVLVMDILREVAKDKLIIMVTHNDNLAEEYSTRIIRMSDGEITGDTNPYTIEECLQDEEDDANAIQEEMERKIAENATNEKERKKYLRKLKKQEFEHRMKTSMSLGTAISMSLTNLRMKLGRSLLTSIAGSIGIIGIMLVLALSTGVSGYISGIEENTLSQYPIIIQSTNMDLMGALKILSGGGESKYPSFPNSSDVHVQPIVSNLNEIFEKFFKKNNLESLKEYIDEEFDDNLGYVKYDYGVKMEIFKLIESSANTLNGTSPDVYTKLYPFVDSVKDVVGGIGFGDIVDTIQQYAGAIDAWTELIDNQTLLDSQYDLLGNSRWPQNPNEIIVVVDEKNQLNDYVLFVMGLIHPEDLMPILLSSMGAPLSDSDQERLELIREKIEKTYTLDDLLNIEYKVMTGNDYYVKNEKGNWTLRSENDRLRDLDFIEENSVTLKVVGVVRPKEGATVTCINGSLAYSHGLVKYLSERAKTKEGSIGQAYFSNEGYSPIDGSKFDIEKEDKFLTEIGVANFKKPNSISIYASSFKNKDKIIEFLDYYNNVIAKRRATQLNYENGLIDENGNLKEGVTEADLEQPDTIKYSDTVAMIMGYVNTLTDTVTRVLVGFAAISLLVSSIMIAIIIYTSVLERKKEIGVLRAVGARKLDVSNVFISESALLGVTSGILGIFVTWLFTLLVNFILKMLLGIPNLATITWWSPIVMLCISVMLSIFAGFIPSRIAATKDPVECLRSE